MRVDRVLSCFTVTIFVFFLSPALFGMNQCLFVFDKNIYEKLYLPSSGELFSNHNYKQINKLADGVYNFIMLSDGSIQVGQKFKSATHLPHQTLASHLSLFNGYKQAAKALHRDALPVVSAGKIILINKQVSQISNLNFDFKNLNPELFMKLISEFKKQGVAINALTRVKLYPESTLKNPEFKDQVQQKEIQRADIMAFKNQNPDLALLWMNAKQFYQQIYSLFPSQKTAGTVNLIKLRKQLEPFIRNERHRPIFLQMLEFLKSVEQQGILLTTYNLYTHTSDKQSIVDFRNATKFFLMLVESYKAELENADQQLKLLLTN